ncbi:UDP pyrophosphate synthase [Arthrobacter sp. RIT-PI-e]|uniref:isoprenyl transferase n=1 Tax=Arthrobacter sp. RIT-PI-e TaxID=1681197 RepID=UPI000675D3D4|nr:isoprenyl transferase [Arthrobacter sp. RIT-PI-e]KNC19649.1 UDP pyrophosphate synthase [Arthrobacter sp. RIT-PI-e]
MTWTFPDLGYSFYERRLQRNLVPERIPHHIGVMVDGNRRWARLAGAPTSHGHRAGADKIHEFLGWCEELGVKVVTLYMLSTDNMGRPQEEIDQLLGIIADTVDRLGGSNRVRVQPVGALDLLPADLGAKLVGLASSTQGIDGLHVNVAVGYGGRRGIVGAVKELLLGAAHQGKSLESLAGELTDQHISSFLYTRGQQDPDLVIRTSGEQRLSGFLMWQSAYSEFYFCEALWPDFRRVDFLRALRDFGRRQRRFGS